MHTATALPFSTAAAADAIPSSFAKDFIPVIENYIKPELIGKEADNFRALSEMVESIHVDGKRLHTAIRYGMTRDS